MSDGEIDVSAVWSTLSEPRMTPYLQSAENDRETALELYVWSARVAAAAFEVVGHLEVLLRNALDRCLRSHFREEQCGIPWFLLPTPGGEHVADAVAVVRERLRPLGQESRHQIVAGLSFGFWAGLIGPKYEDLWRECIHRAFPNSSGKRKQIAIAVERVRRFRNRLAHHDSTINVDIPFEYRQAIELASCIDADAAKWLERCGNVMAVYAQRPIKACDTVVVPAKQAWQVYQDCCAYLCQPGRAFRPVERIAFYLDREIKPEVPAVAHRRDNVEWSRDAASRLRDSTDRNDRKIAKVIDSTIDSWTGGRYQVFLLTAPGHPDHRRLKVPLPHNGTGRGSAFVQKQRYVSLHSLETASTTADV
ncbi:hypothetical protein ALI144C_48390 [Actinosynnema sp. ALI-1.44]|uniref:hypothetical protein n=1 Tax=Actinosynnema sp. ALI-1.44 TaxID=1933779 RepID=UPI00097C8424|nr:hypothetical protein [Actinosynnema sp. ALI-1.44]ONI70473.1 hypothetical protein ALI144C_48390 [Actinosynnema sp. ALI-1.44]